MAPQRIYLHIGAPKTGTSSLQGVLWENRSILDGEGILVPGRRQQDHFRAGRDIRGESPLAGAAGEAFDRLADEILSSTDRAAVISDERLGAATTTQVGAVFDRFPRREVHVVYGVRDFSGLLASSWQQTVKHGNHRRFHDWLQLIQGKGPKQVFWHTAFWKNHDLAAVLSRWDPGERSRLHVITLPGPGSAEDELWRRFAGVIGSAAPQRLGRTRTNESLGFIEATLMADIQSQVSDRIDGKRRERVMKDFVANRVLATRPDATPILVPERHRDWVCSLTEQRKEFLASSGFVLVGDLAELDDRDGRFGRVSAVGREAELLDAAIDVIAALAEGRRAIGRLLRHPGTARTQAAADAAVVRAAGADRSAILERLAAQCGGPGHVTDDRALLRAATTEIAHRVERLVAGHELRTTQRSQPA